MTYNHDQKRKLGFLFFLLVFNLNLLPNTGYFHTKPDIVGHEIISPNIDSVILTSDILRSKKNARNLTIFIETGLLPKFSRQSLINNSIQIEASKKSLNIIELKMEESFLLSHFSTDI